MPLQATSGAASYDAYGGGVAVVPTYIEDVFSTYLYTGNGSTQTITNGIDLSTKGGLVWAKSRSNAAYHGLSGPNFSTSYFGGYGGLRSNQTAALGATDFAGVSTTGFNLAYVGGDMNFSGWTYASWTFRKQPKFFDVQTFTGNGSTQNISHNLGSTPGCIIVKCTSNAGQDWFVYHRTQGNGYGLLNTTDSWGTYTGYWNNTAPTSTQFSVGTSNGVNGNGFTYVAYLFAHDAGGFGLTGTDNVISCGSFSGSVDVNLGYEAQWVLIKDAGGVGDWYLLDIMRGMSNTQGAYLRANVSNAEASTEPAFIVPTATGFKNVGGGNYIYIAIRRGPMKVPTDATKVFAPIARTGNDTETKVTGVGFSPDLWMAKSRNISADFPFFDRLRGVTKRVVSNSTYLEESFSGSNGLVSLDMDGITIGAGATDGGICNDTGTTYANLLFKRAPSFMDVVCYTGTGSARTVSHNLAAVPELLIFKNRVDTGGFGWYTFSPAYLSAPSATPYWNYFELQSTGAAGDWGNNSGITATPTSTTVSLGTAQSLNKSGSGNVLYLFATCAGVSKVGSYTGNGSSQTINCGFTGGARFVLIKATSTTGDWMVSDSARGIIAGSDPYLELNNTNAEVTGEDWLDTDSTGFVVNEVSASNANTNGVSYIFLAIA